MDASGFFRRKRPVLRGRSAEERNREALILHAPNLDEFLFLPVAAGLWRQHELWDGTYTLDDLLDAAELIVIRRENECILAEM